MAALRAAIGLPGGALLLWLSLRWGLRQSLRARAKYSAEQQGGVRLGDLRRVEDGEAHAAHAITAAGSEYRAGGEARRLRKARRHVQARMGGVVERAAHAQLAGVFQGGRFGEPAQGVVTAQRGRGEDPGPRHRGALLGEQVADVQRAVDQAGVARAQVDPAHPVGRRRHGEGMGQAGDALAALQRAVAAGLPPSRVLLGTMVGSDYKHWTVDMCVQVARAALKRWPDFGGCYLWSEGDQAEDAEWARRMAEAMA